MGELKARAKESRTRLKQGFWEEVYKERDRVLQDALENGQDLKLAKENFKRTIKERIHYQNKDEKLSEEEILYKKVCELLDANVVLLNPISKLIDHEVYDQLSDNAKQAYILKLSELYIKLKQRYFVEHSTKQI